MKKFLPHLKMRFVQLMYDKTALFFTFIFPIVLIMGLGYFFSSTGETKIGLLLTQNENETSVLSDFEQKLNETGIFKVIYSGSDLSEAKTRLEKKKAKFLIQLTNQDNTISYDISFNDLDQDGKIARAALLYHMELFKVGQEAAPIQVTTAAKNKLPYIYTIFPGGIGLVFLIIGLMGFGVRIVEERQMGVLKKIKTIDANPSSFLAGLLVTRVLAALLMTVILMVLVNLGFGITIKGSWGLFAIIVILGLMSFMGIGILLANISKNTEQYGGFSNLVQLPLIILGGVFYSIEMLPDWLQVISSLTPLTAFVVSFQKLLFTDIGFVNIFQVGFELTVLAFWSVATMVLGIIQFKW